jgi:plastocyanin
MNRASLFAVAAVASLSGAGCGGGSAPTKPPLPAISMQGLRFHPALAEAHVGQKVRWTNADNVDHNVTATAGATFKSRAFGHGARYSFTPSHAGKIRYVCTLHPGMTGTLNVK